MTSPLAYGLAGAAQGYLGTKAQEIQYGVEEEIYRRRQAAQEIKERRLAEFRAGLNLDTQKKMTTFRNEVELSNLQDPDRIAAEANRTKEINEAAARGRAAGTPEQDRPAYHVGLLSDELGGAVGVTYDPDTGYAETPLTGKKPGKDSKTPEEDLAEQIQKRADSEWKAFVITMPSESGGDVDEFLHHAARTAPGTYGLFKQFVVKDTFDQEAISKAIQGRAPKGTRNAQGEFVPLEGELENPTGPPWKRIFQDEFRVTVARDYATRPGAVAYFASEVIDDLKARPNMSVDQAVSNIITQYQLDGNMQRQLMAEISQRNPDLFSGTVDMLKQTGQGLINLF